ncbi:hypothetical protein C361_04642 [Cryptococcus neoformans Tu259-1]|uniref:Uncharacterized protein n=1 Tax=Cryptococcus neoformans Tu259-1 TaxID=1230072 RepID=A0A854QGZ2_CRYNE|nr:hypothetical protein C361_04642 [Cryptococcus neoformans var. grubii Tu259-1]OXG61311.1 hypothetical protein C351_04220 [Cryptococcus neoformans var. grubii c8]OXH07764.1 hypothetical protein C369_04310 [Cryptococcus neoformans var. grubii A5-35-17]OXH09188.1 hypothetical protein C370_04384 [Cryptococcus neoformans var. grubii A1-35-8]
MTSPNASEGNWASTRAAALARFTSDSPLTSLSPSSASDSPLSSLPSSYQALHEHPKSPRDDPIAYGGHPKNKDRPYPLTLIPFDLSEPYEASEKLIICSYNEACEVDYLGEDWVNMYMNGVIYDEQTFDDRYVRCYLDQFIQKNSKGTATMFSHQANLKAVFYGREDKEWAKLDLVDEYRRRTGKPSQSRSTSRSKKDGATIPDVSLIGYVKDPSCSLGWKSILYAVVELKWTILATHLAGEDKRRADEKTLEYLCQEGVFQTLWYVILGYAISGCIFGLSIINEYFYRVVYLYRESISDIPVLALEADSEFLEKARRHFGYLPDDYSVEELAALPDFWSSPPNCLISDRDNAILNKEARYHLDATILLFLAHAASLPTQHFLDDLPLPFAHSIPVDATSRSAAEMRLKGLKAGHRRHSLYSNKKKKRTSKASNDDGEEDASGDDKPPGKDNDGSQGGNSGPGSDNTRGGGLVLAEAADTRTPTTRQEFLRGLEKLSTPGDMSNVKSSIVASLISNSHATPSTAPSSPGTDSSGSSDYISDISLGSNDRTLVHDHPSADPHIKVHKSPPLDTDLDDIDSESGELTLAAYRDRLAMLGVRVKLVTREQMDVLLARG